ncbi:putative TETRACYCLINE-EFFLUX TRANSPORTER [Vibrio nigripulchritudo SO65]|uniref:MFS transporter n=1 Tax=Vibrio nigripulchritudo TaxID=28173 RepID=UPI0003B1F08D|nr:MFS transporter [Vibrio nigripulchritudo]CCN37795.1 putative TETRACYCLINE-EFFLUX TRANSPORTER [Vibrio nigripulchritudo AM115]CCN44781.1 putative TETRACYCLINE-EFFLUX TRANSPORTER [Vibrio nigripulchritudo FTn2]CCN62899.1 putative TETRACYCLINE-EFFLUX TRANSPORTER [Vibrio nigripulchritudo POn4]CCN77885.1 putative TETRACYCLINE-EFFLUX TRANSPORTER [Vibrio nigripulchritudo SO65]
MSPLKQLFILNAVCMTAMMSIIPVIGPIIREVGLLEWHGGLVVAMSGITWLLSAKKWGTTSDRKGRKPVLLIATLGYAISFILMTIWLDLSLQATFNTLVILVGMIVTRALVGLFLAAIAPVSTAFVADITTAKERQSAMASIGAASAIGLVAGPALGGWLSQYSLTLPLYVLSIFPVIAWIFIKIRLPETQTNIVPPANTISFFDPRLRFPAIAMFICMFAVITAQIIIGFLVLDRIRDTAEETAQLSGIVLTITGITLVITQGMLAKSQGNLLLKSCIIGPIAAVAGLCIVSVAHSALALIAGYVFMAFGLGLLFPTIQAITANSVGKDEQGAAAGTISAVQGLSSILVPIIATVLYQSNQSFPYWFAASLMVVLFLLVLTNQAKFNSPDTSQTEQADLN